MNILVNRTNTENKGAELMLYAVLQELERIHPDATVILPYTGFKEGLSYIRTPVKMLFRKGKRLYDILDKSYLLRISRKLLMPLTFFTDMYPVEGIDYFIDAGGFQFSDQIGYRINTPERWERLLKSYKKQGTKIVFLPQAFGPFKKETGKELMRVICKFADLIFSREEVSYKYITECGVNSDNIDIAPDFPANVNFRITA
jgi:polysaccharide pyruvyl transferase WcaK-like protein